MLGIPVDAMLMLSFALSAALGAAAGILITPMQYTAYSVGGPFGVNGFIAAIIGGFGSAPAALAGGILLGLVQSGAIVVFGAGYKNVIALTILPDRSAVLPAWSVRWPRQARHDRADDRPLCQHPQGDRNARVVRLCASRAGLFHRSV